MLTIVRANETFHICMSKGLKNLIIHNIRLLNKNYCQVIGLLVFEGLFCTL